MPLGTAKTYRAFHAVFLPKRCIRTWRALGRERPADVHMSDWPVAQANGKTVRCVRPLMSSSRSWRWADGRESSPGARPATAGTTFGRVPAEAQEAVKTHHEARCSKELNVRRDIYCADAELVSYASAQLCRAWANVSKQIPQIRGVLSRWRSAGRRAGQVRRLRSRSTDKPNARGLTIF